MFYRYVSFHQDEAWFLQLKESSWCLREMYDSVKEHNSLIDTVFLLDLADGEQELPLGQNN